MRRWLLAAALGLAVVVPAWLLAGAAWNRTGPALASLTLDQRELTVAGAHDASAGLSLRLRWNQAAAPVLDAPTLQALGFDLDARSRSRRPRSRIAHALFQFDPAQWQADVDHARAGVQAATAEAPLPAAPFTSAAAGGGDAGIAAEAETPAEGADVTTGMDARATGAVAADGARGFEPPVSRNVEEARRHLRQARQASRLFLREVAADAGSLHARCPEPGQCLVLPVRVSMPAFRSPAQPSGSGAAADADRSVAPAGRVAGSLAASIHVPARWHASLLSAVQAKRANATRSRVRLPAEGAGDATGADGPWQVRLHQGRRLELWLAQVVISR